MSEGSVSVKSGSKKPAKTSEKLQPADFVHLHNHTHYSVLDGLQKIPEMLDRVKELGMEAVALTDHGTMSGVIEFYKGAKERGIKPIIGMEAYVANRGHLDKDPQKDRSRFHLILLAMNEIGYKNLMRLSTIANLDGFYFKPRIDHELLEKYSEGLIALSSCVGGEVGEHLRNGDVAKAEEFARWYKNLFGDRYYLELQDHAHMWDEQKRVNDLVVELADRLEIPMVITCDAHYCRHEDQEAHEILLCVQTGSFLSDANRFSLTNTDLYVSDPADVMSRWEATRPDVIKNTRAIADRCDVEIELGKILIPKFPVPEGEDEKSYLHKLTYRGLANRTAGLDVAKTQAMTIEEAKEHLSPEVLERTEYELGVIESMGFNGYFLIIWDFIKWGKDAGIVFGPGRGSAAGSIVAYSLKITDLDPLHYGLMFERFLNPDRISMPDIDIDIQDTRRDEVIQYVTQKYGKERVANIVTFGKMFARNAVRDVSRVLQVPYADADRWAKMIPPPVQGRHIPLKKSLVENADLKAEYESSALAKKVFDTAVLLEGTIRSHGIHAAGVVIAPEELVGYAPLEMAQKGVVATQYSMNPVEELGLLKMDFLGLSNLTVIKNALRIIKKVYKTDIDIGTIPLDDKKTFELLQRGETTGVFQFESSGMKRYLKELKPTVFDDVVAMGALYRPGPLSAGLTDSYIKRKNGKEAVSYAHPLMENSLKNTFGVLVYQEQVMQVSREVCNFTGGEADTLRKAIGKKKLDVMEKMRVKFIDGAVANGVPKDVIEKFWHDLLGFADYCFNKSHSACYGLISYQTAYLKAHYPAAFMAALMTNDYDDTDRLSIDITECKHMGIEVLAPDVNESFHEFAVVPSAEKPTIRFGMDAVKNVGRGAVEEIIRAREDGRFDNISDLFMRINLRLANKKNWESLIKAGALDSFGSRGALLNSIESVLSMASKMQKEVSSAQVDLFGSIMGESMIAKPNFQLQEPATPPTKQELLTWERELLGLYLSEHPLDDYKEYLADHAVGLKSITPRDDAKQATVGGTIADIRQILTKKGDNMAFVRLEDATGEIEVIVFPKILKDQAAAWARDNVVMISGRVSGTDMSGAVLAEPKIIAETVELLTLAKVKDYQPSGARPGLQAAKPVRKWSKDQASQKTNSASAPVVEAKLYLRIVDASASDVLVKLKGMLEKYNGPTEVVLVLGPDPTKQAVKLPHKIQVDETVVRELAELIGRDNVVDR